MAAEGKYMGEKYTPEKLERLRSIGMIKGGRTRHNNAGVPIKEVREDSGEKRVTIDANDAVITENKDGSQDLHLHPKPVAADFRKSEN